MADKFGGVSLSEIEEFSLSSALPDLAGASSLTRFVKRVSEIVELRKDKGEHGGISVFLLSEAVDDDVGNHPHTDYPLLATGNDPIQCQAWLSNVRVGSAYALANLDCSDAGILKRSIKELGLGSLPALFIDWRGDGPVGQLFANGVSDPENADIVQLGLAEIEEAELKACLDNFYDKSLCTPGRINAGHGQKIWREAGKGIPEDRPEERIQGRLLDHLRARFSRHNIRAEVENEAGRCDLVVRAYLSSVAGKKTVRVEWLLELKALAEKTASGNLVPKTKVSEALQKGVLQAYSYRDKEHAEKAVLCCYDLRDTDENDEACFADITAEANTQSVLLWRWILLRSAESGRQHAAAH